METSVYDDDLQAAITTTDDDDYSSTSTTTTAIEIQLLVRVLDVVGIATTTTTTPTLLSLSLLQGSDSNKSLPDHIRRLFSSREHNRCFIYLFNTIFIALFFFFNFSPSPKNLILLFTLLTALLQIYNPIKTKFKP